MGRYIQHPNGNTHGKGEYLRALGAKVISEEEAIKTVEQTAIIVLVDNGLFEAAGYAYDARELHAWTQNSAADPRPRTYFAMDRQLAEELAH